MPRTIKCDIITRNILVGQGISMDRLILKKEQIVPMQETKFLNMYDIQYKEGKHYYNVTRRKVDDTVALMSTEQFQEMFPDAVTIAVVLYLPNEAPKLLLSYEYRYPVGQFLLSPVAGLIDKEDLDYDNPLITAAVREIKEETGLTVKDTDEITVLNPCTFASPGMTDESNAFLCAKIYVDNLDELNQDGAVGSEMFDGVEVLDRTAVKDMYMTGRDKNGNFLPLQTWAVMSYFLLITED